MVQSYVEQYVLLPLLKFASIPKHIGFIMDGNRRYAKKRQLPSIKGHDMGSDKLLQVLEWCLILGVQEVSVYAFSIDNFKRSPEEVMYLMDLAAAKFNDMAEDSFLITNRVKVSFWGNLSLLPSHVKEACDKLVATTSAYQHKVRLNILFAYSSEFEGSRARELAGPENLEISSFLFSKDSFPLDLIVRTSGETRLSDFMILQISQNTLILFLNVFWPELSLFRLGVALFHFTRFKRHS
jgi:ditrans,polycis-polyprenyl diphosphate synthase